MEWASEGGETGWGKIRSTTWKKVCTKNMQLGMFCLESLSQMVRGTEEEGVDFCLNAALGLCMVVLFNAST